MKANFLAFTSQFIVPVILAAVLLVPVGCAGVETTGSAPNASDPQELVICPEPRPQICTREYRVVCAQMQDGSFKEYPNGCTSCTDPDVIGYREGNCGSDK